MSLRRCSLVGLARGAVGIAGGSAIEMNTTKITIVKVVMLFLIVFTIRHVSSKRANVVIGLTNDRHKMSSTGIRAK